MEKVIYSLKLESHKKISKMAAIILLGFSIFLQTLSVYAGTALEQVKSDITEVIAILDDKSFRDSHSREELDKKLREIVHEGFDWGEIARRTLGLYWKERSQDEKKEFTLLLTNLLKDAYITKIVDNYSGERVLYDKEVIDGKRALVETRIINKAEKEIYVGYRLVKKGDRWIAYDVIIEGVSLVKNYRVQFYTIIRKSSYDELIKKLREKRLLSLKGKK